MDRNDEHRSSSNLKSRESTENRPHAPASGMATGDVIQVNMARLADVLGCSLEELLQSLKRTATQEAEVAVEALQQLDHKEAALHPSVNIRQALMTTVSSSSASAWKSGEEYLPRPLWVLERGGGKTVIELVLLNLMRGGVERVVIIVGEDGARIKEAVSRSGVIKDDKIAVEFLQDRTEPHRQSHAKSLLRARGAFDSPFLLVASDHFFHPSLLHLLAAQDLGEDGGCVLVEDVQSHKFIQEIASTAVFVRRVQPEKGERGEVEGDQNDNTEVKVSPRVMAIGRRDQGQRQQWDGIDCGAMVLSTEIFDELADIGKRRRYFTLADGLDRMAGQGLLRSVSTNGKPWLALETEAQLRQGHEALVQGLLDESDLFPSEFDAGIGIDIAATGHGATLEESETVTYQRRVHLAMDRPQTKEEKYEAGPTPDFKGFVLPIRTTVSSEPGLASSILADDTAFLTRGHPHRERVALDDATVQVEKPTPPAHNVDLKVKHVYHVEGSHDPEAGNRGNDTESATVTLPWLGEKLGQVGFIVSVPGEGGGDELVFAVPDLSPKPAPAPRLCFGKGEAKDSDSDSNSNIGRGEEAGLLPHDADQDDEPMDGMDDYNCLGGGMLNACLPVLPMEMPSDIRSVYVTTEVVANREGEESTLAVHVVVDRSVPALGWVILVMGLFASASKAPLGDLVSKMSPESAAPIHPVWRYTCSSIMYSPWFFLVVAGSKSARAELRDWSLMLPIVVAGMGVAAWGLCFYTALSSTDPNMVALLSSLTPMFLVVWRGITGESIHAMEIIGVLLALAGGIVSAMGEGGDKYKYKDTASTEAGVEGMVGVEGTVSDGGQIIGYALGLGAACFGGLYILNAKAVRNKVEVSHFAFLIAVVAAFVCTAVLSAGYGRSPEGRKMLLGPSGLLGWTKSPGLALTQIVTSILADVIGSLGFYLLLKYISPLVLSLASLTVPLLAVVEGIMLGVVPPPNALFGIGALLILVGAATASLVTMLPHKEVFDATDAVKMANDGPQTARVDKSLVPGSGGASANPPGYGSIANAAKERSSIDSIPGGRSNIRSNSFSANGVKSRDNHGNGYGVGTTGEQYESKDGGDV